MTSLDATATTFERADPVVLDAAGQVVLGVSTRHLSFVETGRSRPSPELLLTIAEHLEVPLRERNDLLIAAGHAPRYARTPLDDDAMARVRSSMQRMLDAHDPYPGVVIDRSWNVVDLGGQPMSLFTTLTTFGTPRDITLEELSVELFFPADDETDRVLTSA